MTTLRLTVEYDGTEFRGFQWQPEVRTIAGVLESALGRLFAEPVKVTGAGRTDRGVHATGQVVSMTAQRGFPLDRLLVALNANLPQDCAARAAAEVDAGFSARFAALERTYVYAILNHPARRPLLGRYAWHVARPLDLDAMRAAAAPLLGTHDFRSFATLEPGQPSTRTVRRLEVERRGDLLRIEIAADGFLHHMVRTIVGTLAECGMGRRSPGEVPALLKACERAAAGSTAPAHGLYLAGVRYPDGYDSCAEPPLLGHLDAGGLSR